MKSTDPTSVYIYTTIARMNDWRQARQLKGLEMVYNLEVIFVIDLTPELALKTLKFCGQK